MLPAFSKCDNNSYGLCQITALLIQLIAYGNLLPGNDLERLPCLKKNRDIVYAKGVSVIDSLASTCLLVNTDARKRTLHLTLDSELELEVDKGGSSH